MPDRKTLTQVIAEQYQKYWKGLYSHLKKTWEWVKDKKWLIGLASVFLSVYSECVYYSYFGLNLLNYTSDFSVTTLIAIRLFTATIVASFLIAFVIIIGTLVHSFGILVALLSSPLVKFMLFLLARLSQIYFRILSSINAEDYDIIIPHYSMTQFAKCAVIHITKYSTLTLKVVLSRMLILLALVTIPYVVLIEPMYQASLERLTSDPIEVLIDSDRIDTVRQYRRIGATNNWVFILLTNITKSPDATITESPDATSGGYESSSFWKLVSKWYKECVQTVKHRKWFVRDQEWKSMFDVWFLRKQSPSEHIVIAVPFTRVRCSFRRSQSPDVQNVCSDRITDPPPIVDIQPIYFDLNRNHIKMSEEDKLTKAAKLIGDNPESEVLVVGHTDKRGTSRYNWALGGSRAAAVRGWIRKRDNGDGSWERLAERLRVVSSGEKDVFCSDPKPNDECHASNRRAELHLWTK